MAAEPEKLTPEEQLLDDIAQFRHDPQGFALYAFPWGEGELEKYSGPRAWQAEINEIIRAHLTNPETRYMPLLIAVASGHGIGKSAEMGMLSNWALSTCADAKMVLTANTAGQLRTKTMPELAKWFRLAINAKWWKVRSESIHTAQESHIKLWRLDAVPWSERNTEAFAGLHNVGKRIVVLFDEASGIPAIIWEVTEGALTDEETEIIWIVFGNPTQVMTRFHACFTKLKHRWVFKQIDSRTVEGTNKAQIQKWIDDWGEDSDFVRVRVRGEFPRAGTAQMIAADTVAAARKYKAVGFESLPKIMSVDVARFGDDQTVIGMRQGRKYVCLDKLRGKDNAFVGNRVIQLAGEHHPNAVVIDGDGLGAGVIDHIRFMGYGGAQSAWPVHEFHGGHVPDEPQKYFNKRCEVWGLMRDWLKAGAEIPDDPELEDDLCGPEYFFNQKDGTLRVESKDDMKARGLSSPDNADTLAMSFGVKVAPPRPQTQEDYCAHSGEHGWMG